MSPAPETRILQTYRKVRSTNHHAPMAAIAAEAQNHEAPKGKPGLAWRKAARALVIRELLLQEAVKLGQACSWSSIERANAVVRLLTLPYASDSLIACSQTMIFFVHVEMGREFGGGENGATMCELLN